MAIASRRDKLIGLIHSVEFLLTDPTEFKFG